MRKVLLALVAGSIATTTVARPFSFVALGDTGYQLPRDAVRVDKLISAINAEGPAFSIHVGDFKGYSSCSDQAYRAIVAQYQQLKSALIVTPGDNDWFDCSADSAGRFDPIERLSALRQVMFSGPSLGGKELTLVRQDGFPENARWSHEGIVFATVHVMGPHNGFVRDAALSAEAVGRSAAGEQWVREAFAAARRSKAPGIVIAFQADPWITSAPVYEDGPLDWLRNTIGEEAATFPGQVLAVHGDSHRLVIDTPYRRANIDAGTTTGLNVSRLMVPGWPDHRAVRVDVDSSRHELFGFRVVMSPDEATGAKP